MHRLCRSVSALWIPGARPAIDALRWTGESPSELHIAALGNRPFDALFTAVAGRSDAT
jgi:hypothetical protein